MGDEDVALALRRPNRRRWLLGGGIQVLNLGLDRLVLAPAGLRVSRELRTADAEIVIRCLDLAITDEWGIHLAAVRMG